MVLRLQPDAPYRGGGVPLLLLGVRDEFTDRAWRPPARHWAGSPLTGGMDEQAGGTWLAVRPGDSGNQRPDGPRVACLLNGRGTPAAPQTRRSRGELPLRAAAEGAGALKDLADDPHALAAYDPFHLVCADAAGAMLLSWEGSAPVLTDLPPGTHVLTNAGHAYPREPAADPKAAHFGPKFSASADPSVWLALADGDGLAPDDPRAIVARRTLPEGRAWGTTSQTLVTLAPEGVRYDFRPVPGEWYEVPV